MAYNKAYSGWLTLWKAAGTLLVSGGIVTGAVLADMEEAAIVLLPAVLALVRAFENWRKNSGKYGRPRWNWPWDALAPMALMVVFVGMTGCATNGFVMSETGPDGSTFDLQMKQQTTPWAKVEEGSNNIAYSGPDWSLAAGNAATKVEGGDPTEVLLRMMEMLLSGYMGRLNAPVAPETPGLIQQVITDPRALEMLLNALRAQGVQP